MSNFDEHEAEQDAITAAWEARHAAYLPRPHAADAPRFYVTLTWDNWPEGGSYGATVQADNHADAEHAVRWEMAQCRVNNEGYVDEAYVIEAYGDDWHLVDCFNLEEFLADKCRGAPPRKAAAAATATAEANTSIPRDVG